MLRFCLLVSAMLIAVITPHAATAESRVALVVGNSAYSHTTPLANPANDAREMTAALKATGFDVVEALDADKRKLDSALRSFTEKLASADVALFFYAGHGLQVGAQNYLVPIDAQLTRERDLAFEAVRVDFVLRQMEIDREGKTSIVILDACRDNPLSRNLARSMGTRSTAIGRGLAPTATGLGTFIAYATQPGNVALDGSGNHSPFTTALLKHMSEKGRTLYSTMIEVRKDVVAATGGDQVPWDHSALTGDFYFVPDDGAPRSGTVTAAPTASTDDLAALKQRLRKLEEEARSREMQIASGRLDDLKRREADLAEQSRTLQFKLLDMMRELGQTSDTNAKARINKDLMNLRMEISRRGQDLARVRQELETAAGLQTKTAAVDATPPVIPPVTPAMDPNASAADFSRDDNVRLEGNEIRSFRAPNPDACRNACADEADCVGFQHGRKIPVMGTCTLYSAVSARHADKSWRSGMRGAAAKTATLLPPQLLGQKPSRTEHGFQVFEGASLEGDVIKMAGADSTSSCITVCRNTSGCTAAVFLAKSGQLGNMCTAYGRVTKAKTGMNGAQAIIRE